MNILGLFPRPDSSSFGGVQLSGLEAWEAVTAVVGDHHADTLYYEAGSSKLRALLNAVGKGKHADVLLVWHLHLLKLLPALRMPKARIVVFLHGIEAWRRQSVLMRSLLGRVDVFLANSHFTWAEFVRWNPEVARHSHTVTHLGTGVTLGASTPRPSPTPAVLMIGRLDKGEDYKGHRQMIAAWRQVVDRIPEAKLWIVGDGTLRPALEDLARHTAPVDSIQFFGKVSDTEKERLLAACRCFALPSRGEGFGLVYLEAMRVGRPCLVSTLDAGREVVNPPQAGLAVDPDDHGELAAAVCTLLSSGAAWDRWSNAARQRYESHFTREQFQQRFVRELIGT